MSRKKVLVCPIDWGLGHASRSCPVIAELIQRGCEVSIASSGPALAFLRKEFPLLQHYQLTGYRPYYSTNGSLIWSLATQSRKFMTTIRAEHSETERIVRREGIDAVISDNRFGCWSEKVPSAVISHQLRILAPGIVSGIINRNNRRLLQKFSACWVPDYEGSKSVAGEMVNPDGLTVKFIGPLSRFTILDSYEKKYRIIGLVSGPEPQRQILEDLLRRELKKGGMKALLVKGQPDRDEISEEGLLTERSHLASADLNRAIQGSEIVISRSGYSTIMDLEVVGSKAIFIPTPGQPEQEYLGKRLMNQKIAYSIEQNKFNLVKALAESGKYTGFVSAATDLRNAQLRVAIDQLLQ